MKNSQEISLLLVAHAVSMASHTAHTPGIVQAALPILPILLLPFILIFFVVVFPIWLVSMGVLSLLMLLMRGLASVVHRRKPGALDSSMAGIRRLRRWVMTFGGLAGNLKGT